MSEPRAGSAADAVVEHVTCLGCGCACDDVTVVVRDGAIAEARRACPLGRAWFGDGRVPAAATVEGRAVPREAALDAAAVLLAAAHRPVVWLVPGLSCEAQRAGAAIADGLGALLDTITTETAAAGVLASQRLGRASATFGEVRHRADVVLLWDVDVTRRYPRLLERYIPPAADGGARRILTVAVGDGGAGGADVVLAPDEEIAAAALLRALLGAEGVAASGGTAAPGVEALAGRLAPLVRHLAAARYAAVLYDAEPAPGRRPGRAEALIRLVDALHARTRAALVALRGGGNRFGADLVLTWQTGFPMAADFARGAPRYTPHRGATRLLAEGEADVVLLAGDAAALPAGARDVLAGARVVRVGPRASEGAPPAAVAIDTGTAGVHEGGTAVRADGVPLPLRPSLGGPPGAAATLAALGARLAAAPDARVAPGERGEEERRATARAALRGAGA
jgi:formylmethanofuran dehydrogenase subunit B